MLEAMWSVDFVSNHQGAGSGIIVLETGRLMGGDSSYMYRGTYKVVNGEAQVEVKVTKYAPGLSSVFGDVKEFNLVLKGTPSEKQWVVKGHMVENPNSQIAIQLTRQGELP